MCRRRTVLLAFVLSIAAWSADPASIEFVHLSDTHVTNLKIAHPGIAAALETKKDSAARFSRVLDSLQQVSPSFILITGDLIDAYSYDSPGGKPMYRQIEVFKAIFDRSPIPIFPVLGNHDLTQYHAAADTGKPATDQSVAADARREWRRSIPNFREGTYYTFRKAVGGTGYLFIVLDDGEAKGRDEGFAATELAWLKAQIAAHPHDAIVVAMHIPLLQAPFWQGLKPILADAPNVVLSMPAIGTAMAWKRWTWVRAGWCRCAPRPSSWARAIGASFRLRPDEIDIFATGKPEQLEKTVAVKPAAVLTGKLLVNPVADPQVPLRPIRMGRLP